MSPWGPTDTLKVTFYQQASEGSHFKGNTR